MKIRYWILLMGSAMAVFGMFDSGLPWWREWLLVLGGGLVGIWADEGQRAHALQHGVILPPL